MHFCGHHIPLASGRGSPPPRLLRLGPQRLAARPLRLGPAAPSLPAALLPRARRLPDFLHLPPLPLGRDLHIYLAPAAPPLHILRGWAGGLRDPMARRATASSSPGARASVVGGRERRIFAFREEGYPKWVVSLGHLLEGIFSR